MKRSFCEWRVTDGSRSIALPRVFLGPAWPGEYLAPEIGLLLPTAGSAIPEGADGVATFLADPALVAAQLARRLSQSGAEWVVNLPSVAQHEAPFRRLLAEVDLDYAREMRVLADLKAGGLQTLAALCDANDVAAAEAAAPSAILALPPVEAFADGFPLLAHRIALEEDIASDTHLPVLGLRADGEPLAGRDAALLRPRPLNR